MSGHSKWSQIKRQKGVADVKRGQVFTRLTREVIVAARQGGGDPEGNIRLRMAIQKARENNMPMDNIERAIKRGLGETEGAALSEITYEIYGPGGTAIMVEVVTDNKNRTISELRQQVNRHGGNMGESGSVAWLFEPRGVIIVEQADHQQVEDIELAAIDAGAEDIESDEGSVEVLTAPQDLEQVREALMSKGFQVTSAEHTLRPKTNVPLDEQTAVKLLRFLDELEDLDDVQKVHSNADFPEEAMERYEAVAAERRGK